MNKRIRLKGLNGHPISLTLIPELLGDNITKKIKNVWTLFDEKFVLENAPFHPMTGERVTKAEDAVLEHHKGVFLEDYMHDWKIKDDQLYIYSRTTSNDKPIELLIELNNLNIN